MVEPSPLTARLLELFKGPLRDVRFPDADGERLEAVLAAATGAKAALAEAQRALETARATLTEKERLVTQETERALAYVRVYAVNRPELRSALVAVPARSTVRRPPGRPRKSTPDASARPTSSEAAAE